MINQNQIQECLQMLSELECIKLRPTFVHTLSDLKKRLNDDTFRIAVVGEFSSGKSTFINALIGRDILTHAVNETTAAITYIYNVSESDPRRNTCEITYNDGRKISVQNLSEIREYTTVQSKLSVAETISFVTVYINFMNTNVPFIIVDTPGLNGTASGHRNITIGEIGKAHACIYLVSLRGLTKSDAEFVKFLAGCQSEFVFVQNFIDELQASDGESSESKLSDLRAAVEECLSDTGANYSICGISALKALVGRDDRIEYLYSTDTEKVTPQKRSEIYRQSQFDTFESIIRKLITSGKYRDVVYRSVLQSMKFVIKSLLPGINRQLADEEALARTDKYSTAADMATKRIEMIQNLREKNCTKLSNFIVSRNKVLAGSLKNYIASEITELYNTVCCSIEDKLKTYDDYNNIRIMTGENVSEIFSNEVNNCIRNEIVPEINRTIINGYNDIYSAALVRAAEYSGMVERENSYYVDVESDFDEIKVADTDLEHKIESIRYDIECRQKEVNRFAESAESARKEMGYLSANDTEQARKQVNAIEGRIARMGNMPDVEYRQVERRRKKERNGIIGFFQKIGDIFTGGEYETYMETVPDDSKQKKWREDHEALVTQLIASRQEYDNRKMLLKKKQDTLRNEAERNTLQSEAAKRSVELLQKKLQELEFMQNEAIKVSKSEYCKSIRMELKAEFESELSDTDNDNSMIVRLTEYVEKMSSSNLANVTKLSLEQLNSGYDMSVKHLESIVMGNNSRIEEIMAASRKEAEILNTLLEKAETIGGQL